VFTIDADMDDYEVVGTYTLKQAIDSKAVPEFGSSVFDKAANMVALRHPITP